jgi:predicted RNA-binding protein Jag
MDDIKITLPGVTQECIPRMIGKGGVGMKKNVVFPSWKMYEEFQKSDKKVDEDKPSLFVGLSDGEDNSVEATVKTSSETMQKFAMYCATKYANEVHQRSQKKNNEQVHTLFAPVPQSSIGLLVGKQGSVLKSIISDAAESFNGSSEEKNKAMKSFVKIDPYSYESITDLNKMVRGNEAMSFLGWPPEEGDEDEYVSIRISNYMSSESFLDFYTEFNSFIDEKIKSINSQHEHMASSIRDALQ